MEEENKNKLISNTLEESKQLLESFSENKEQEKKDKEEEATVVKFTHKLHDKYGFLSNLYECKITIDKVQFKSVEHFYQAMKFEGTKKFEVIRRAGKAIDAHKLAQKKDTPKDKNWKEMKIVYMRKAIQAKFEQNPNLKQLLLETEDKTIIDVTPNDNFWAIGTKQEGKNLNGKILEGVRAELQKQRENSENIMES